MKQYQISEQDAQLILNYLAGCPYAQVARLVEILLNLKTIEKDENTDSKL